MGFAPAFMKGILIMKSAPWWKKINLQNLFKRRPNRFIELLIQQAQITEEGTAALVAYFEKPRNAAPKQLISWRNPPTKSAVS